MKAGVGPHMLPVQVEYAARTAIKNAPLYLRGKYRTMKRLLAFLLFSFGLAGCSCHDEPCRNGSIGVKLKGFSPAELQNIIVRRFSSDGFYQNLLDSTRGNAFVEPTFGPDTLLGGISVYGGYNWEIDIPAASRKVRIYQLEFSQQTQKVCNSWPFEKAADICVNQINGYTQDSIYHNLLISSASYNYAVFEK